MSNPASRPLAFLTGASSGIGLELARECAKDGYDLVLASDRPLDGWLSLARPGGRHEGA